MSTDLIIKIAEMLFSAGAIYGAIRMDIKNIHRQIEDIRDGTKEAHRRIDDVLIERRR